MRNPSWGPRNKQPLRALSVSTTVIPQGGAITATATYSYTKIATNLINALGSIVITNVGTGTGVLDINIPFVPAETTPATATQIAPALLGLAGQAFNNGGQGQLRIFKPDGTTAIAVGTLVISATFRI